MVWPRWVPVAIAAAALDGCAFSDPPERIELADGRSFAWPVWTVDGLYLASPHGPGALFLAPRPLDLRGYRGVFVEDIEIGTKPGLPELDAVEAARIERYVRRDLLRLFRVRGLPAAEAPGPDVLHVRVAARNIDMERSDPHLGTSVVNSSGDAEFIVELRDVREPGRLLLFADRRALPFGAYSATSDVEVLRIEAGFVDFHFVLGQVLDRAQRGGYPPPPEPAQASGAIENQKWNPTPKIMWWVLCVSSSSSYRMPPLSSA